MSGLIDSLCERYSTDYQRMATALDAALAEIDRLRLENANLRTENRELRRMLQDHELRMLREPSVMRCCLVRCTSAAATHRSARRRPWAWVKTVGAWLGSCYGLAVCCAKMAAIRCRHQVSGNRALPMLCGSSRLRAAIC
jgi:hypothetical protein